MVNTILVEDDRYMLKHFSLILESDERFRLVGTFRDAFDIESRCGADVDLVLMDILTLHKHSGLAAGRRIKERFPHIKVVVITSLIDRTCFRRQSAARRTACGTRITARRSCLM